MPSRSMSSPSGPRGGALADRTVGGRQRGPVAHRERVTRMVMTMPETTPVTTEAPLQSSPAVPVLSGGRRRDPGPAGGLVGPEPRRARRRDRPVRFRQVDAPQPAGRARRTLGRNRVARGPADEPPAREASRRDCAPGAGHTPGRRTTCSPSLTVRANLTILARLRGSRRPRGRAPRVARHRRPGDVAAAPAVRWRAGPSRDSPLPWSEARPSCWPTSRQESSTETPRTSCWICSAIRPPRVLRSSSPATAPRVHHLADRVVELLDGRVRR